MLFSKEYNVTSEELRELYEAISRRNGVAFMSRAAGFVDEHKAHADRWDLRRLFLALLGDISFHVAGSAEDPFEPKQIVKARELLGNQGLDIRMLPGGHLTTSEHPELLAEIIREVGRRRRPPRGGGPSRDCGQPDLARLLAKKRTFLAALSPHWLSRSEAGDASWHLHVLIGCL